MDSSWKQNKEQTKSKMAFTRATPPTWRKPFFYDIEAGTKVSISAEDGTEIYTFESSKTFSGIVFSCPELEQGKTYIFTAGEESQTVTLDEVNVQ